MDRSPEMLVKDYVAYLRDMGIYDLYVRDSVTTVLPEEARAALLARATKVAAAPVARPAAPPQPLRPAAPTTRPSVAPPARPAPTPPPAPDPFAELSAALPPELLAPMPRPKPFDELAVLPDERVPAGARMEALDIVRKEIGDCTRCPLAYAGRHNIVFADGDPNAELMFIGEGPGADEDASGLPFVGKAGQLLNNMIGAMGLTRQQVYIANIVKCRPPGNRAPEFAEASVCTQFLVKQIDIVQPKVIVALGKTAANYVRGNTDSLTSQRGQWFATRGAKLLVTFHPAFLLRDPRQKAEAWKDLQMVMKELGLQAPKKA